MVQETIDVGPPFTHYVLSYLNIKSYTDYWQCIWAHIQDLSSSDHEALAGVVICVQAVFWILLIMALSC